ncbi:MAG: glycosyltransferase [Steroidobacteraceae bacterium]|jgi:alpha-1,6-mannosyltransferase
MHVVDTTLFYSLTSGGVKRYLTAKQAWLHANTAHRHTLLVPGLENRLVRNGVSTVAGMRLPGTFNYRLPLAARTWKSMLLELEPDLIEVGDVFHPAWCALTAARTRHVPVVAFFHSNLPRLLGNRFGSGVERAVTRYLRLVYERVDLVLAPSRSMCAYLRQCGVPNVAFQPLGVDTALFSPQRRTLELRRMLNLPDDARLVVFAGRFSEEKKIHVLRAAMALLGEPYHLLLVGGGRSAQPSQNVTVLPYRRDSVELAQWLASADALVHAGNRETFGLVVVEAMACGRPVVGVRAGSIPELVDERVGELAEPDDAPSMAAAIRRLYERDIHALGAQARSRVLQRYTWAQALTQQLATYANVLGAVHAPRSLSAAMELESPGP